MALPKKNEAYEYFISLVDALDAEAFKANPTLATGDFTISKDGGAFANLATLPAVAPAGGVSVKVSLSADEMNADKVYVRAKDVAGAEWFEVVAFIDVPTGNVDNTYDLLVADHLESSINMKKFKRGTSTVLLEKTIAGSLLDPAVTITTTDP